MFIYMFIHVDIIQCTFCLLHATVVYLIFCIAYIIVWWMCSTHMLSTAGV